MIKAGTTKELSQFEAMIDRDMYREALRIVNILDDVYGTDRDVDNGDGGFVLIAQNIQDVELIQEKYKYLDSHHCEVVDVFNGYSGQYINAFYLSNNEFGINILMPVGIAPTALLGDLSEKIRQNQ